VGVPVIKVGSGKYRSRVLLTPEEGTLPTKNMVREAMMSMVQDYLYGANVLDLFAGSGALGIEALSRGAKSATFVDASPKACAVIKKNLETLKDNNGKVIFASFKDALSRMNEPFDLAFLDPPYAMKESYQEALDGLLAHGLLKDSCAVVLEYEGAIEIQSEAFSSRREYTYGKTKVILLRR